MDMMRVPAKHHMLD